MLLWLIGLQSTSCVDQKWITHVFIWAINELIIRIKHLRHINTIKKLVQFILHSIDVCKWGLRLGKVVVKPV